MKSVLGAWLVVGLLTTVASVADAQAARGAVRLHLETGALGISYLTRIRDTSDRSTTIVSAGPHTTGLGFGVGYAVTDTTVLGGNIVAQVINIDDSSDSATGVLLALAPYVELLLSEGTTRPFIGLQVPFSYVQSENSHATSIGVTGMLGVHLFVAESASLDFSLRPVFDLQTDDDGDRMRTLGVLGMIGVSAWAK